MRTSEIENVFYFAKNPLNLVRVLSEMNERSEGRYNPAEFENATTERSTRMDKSEIENQNRQREPGRWIPKSQHGDLDVE